VHEVLVFAVSGLATGAIYAITASGLTLTYMTTGVFNLAHGATGMLAAFCFWELSVEWGCPPLVALVLCVFVLAPLFGVLMQVAIMRRLGGTSETTRLVATIALLLSEVSLAIWIWNPNTFRSLRPFFAGEVLAIGDIRVPYHDVTVLIAALCVAILLAVLLHRTRLGIAMRANVDDTQLVALAGAKPGHIAAAAWAISTSLAALAGILVAPRLSLAPLAITLLIVNAYAAAVIGRLRSLPMTFVGAIFLGLANDFGINYIAKLQSPIHDYLEGFIGVIPVAVLFVTLLLLPRANFVSRAIQRTRSVAAVPTWRGTVVFGISVVVATAMASTVLAPGDLFSMTKMWGLAIVGLSMVPLTGYAGRLSLCQLTFAGLGAAIVGQLGPRGSLMALVWAAIIVGAIGAVIALPALRLSGIYLALATAAFAVAMDRWLFTLPRLTVLGHDLALFPDQSVAVARFDVMGLSLKSSQGYLIFGAVVFSLLALAVVALRRSVLGRRLVAMSDSPVALVTLGTNTRRLTLMVFAFSAAIAGIGGGVYASGLRTVASNQFDLLSGLPILLVMYLAGVQSIGAAVAVAIILGTPLITNVFPSLTQLTATLIGLAAVALGRNPNGFIPTVLRPHWDAVTRAPGVLTMFLAALGTAWLARLGDLIGNWTWSIATLALIAVLPFAARASVRRRSGLPPDDSSQPGLLPASSR
jgi:branched-chain amino acid transport system permease protein